MNRFHSHDQQLFCGFFVVWTIITHILCVSSWFDDHQPLAIAHVAWFNCLNYIDLLWYLFKTMSMLIVWRETNFWTNSNQPHVNHLTIECVLRLDNNQIMMQYAWHALSLPTKQQIIRIIVVHKCEYDWFAALLIVDHWF